MTEDDRAEIRRGELRLLEPAVRRDPEALAALLHPDFVEIGSSGTTWTRDAILDRLPEQSGFRAEASELAVEALATDIALVTYRVEIATDDERPRSSLRSSIWVRHEGAWKVRFHQGTASASSPGVSS